MKKTIWLSYASLFLLSASVLSVSSCNEDAEQEQVEEVNEEKFDDTHMEYDSEFAVKAATGGMMEVELGKVATAKAQTQEVKDFAQAMITEHSKANEELQTAAAAKNIALPATMTDEQQNDLNRLSEKEGYNFDEEYIDFMVKDHKKDIELFKDQANKGGDADLKAWAQGKVSVLEHHLMMAEQLQEQLKNNKKK